MGNGAIGREVGNGGRKSCVSDVLDEVVQRIVAVADPEKIILFGSAARGELGPDSDLDLLVVKSGVHRRKLAQSIYEKLLGIGCPVDVVVVTPEDIEKYGDAIGLILDPALREGKVIYERKTPTSERSP